jgi:hypothetical protein
MTETPQEPWPITNAIACLKEVRDRENDGSEHAETTAGQAWRLYAGEEDEERG